MPASRFQAIRGSSVRLRIRFEQNQVTLYDPVLIQSVEIIDPGGTVIDTFASGWLQESVGVWYLDYDIAADADLGLYSDRWTYQPYTGYDIRTATPQFAVFAEGATGDSGGYMTVDEIRARGCIDDGCPLEDEQIEYLSILGTAFIEKATGRIFRPWIGSVDVDGSGKCYQHLPGKYRVRSLTSVTDLEGGAFFDAAMLKFRGATVFHESYRGPGCHCSDSFSSFLGCEHCFPCGIKNLRFEGVFGDFDEVPAPIQHALCLLVKAGGADGTVTAPWIVNYSQETVDGQSVSYRDMDPGIRKRSMTGLAEVDAILNLYENKIGHIRSLVR